MEHDGKNIFLTTEIKPSDVEGVSPLLDCVANLDIWESDDVVELTSAIWSKNGLLPFDVMFLTNFSDEIVSYEGDVDVMYINILDFRLALVKFDDFNSLFVERKQLKQFVNALTTNRQGRYTQHGRKAQCA
ncbi:hypothetical protein nACB2_100 [Acinetobacter phage nACB2]|nr:hypothetical protein nACB2_100 [Acinetobacter phage nACB2]